MLSFTFLYYIDPKGAFTIMKDEAHHMKHLNKKVLQKAEGKEGDVSWEKSFRKPLTQEQEKKQKKARLKKLKNKKIPHPDSPEEQNKKRKKQISFHRSKQEQHPKR